MMDLNTIGIDPDIWQILWENTESEKYDIKHLLDSMSPHQIESKVWLVDKIIPHLLEKDDIHVQLFGGWIGFPIVALLNSTLDISFVENIDLDIKSLNVFRRYMKLKNYAYAERCGDVQENGPLDEKANLIINTSSEHMPDMKNIIRKKYIEPFFHRRNYEIPLFAIQSNNMFHIDDHSNCVNSRWELEDKCGLSNIKYSGKLKMSNGYERYMVIGYA